MCQNIPNFVMNLLNCYKYNVENSSYLWKDKIKVYVYKQKVKNNLKLYIANFFKKKTQEKEKNKKKQKEDNHFFRCIWTGFWSETQ